LVALIRASFGCFGSVHRLHRDVNLPVIVLAAALALRARREPPLGGSPSAPE